jgi:hypothetical protein
MNFQNCKMKFKFCDFCNKEIYSRHGNARYCSYCCYYNNKKATSSKLYQESKVKLKEVLRTEKSLKALYDLYGESPLDVTIFSAYDINWNVKTNTISLKNEIFDLVGSYGYLFYSDKKLKIIKHANNDIQ